MQPTTWQKLRVSVFSIAPLGLRQPQGFSAPTMFYLARCKKHGYFEDYLHGINQDYVTCPTCLKERWSNSPNA